MKKLSTLLICIFGLSFIACTESANSDADYTSDTSEQVGESSSEHDGDGDGHDMDSTEHSEDGKDHDSDGQEHAVATQRFNLNTASEEDFNTIPGMTGKMVYEFQEYRPYSSIEQFRKEIGKYVDAEQVAEYEKFVFVPIDINEASAASLQQIPGITESMAQAIISGRPFDDAAAFISKATSVLPGMDAEQINSYLK